MSRNGSGIYSLPAGNPVTTGTTISSTWANTTLTDISTALTGSVASDGQTPMTGILNMNNNKISTVTDPTNAQDAATKSYVDAKTDGTASGSFTDLAYTGTLTGGTGVVNLGSGQVYKDASGNVGIGTSSPTAQLETNYNFTGKSLINAAILGGADAAIGFTGIKVAYKDASSLISGSSFPLQVFTNNVSQMCVTGTGNLLVGSTTFNADGSVCIGPIGTASVGCTAVSASSSATNMWRFYNPNGNVGTISTSGSATTYATSSDYRLKENIVPMTGALDKVSQLKPVTYKWKSDGSDGQGFIAHELQAIVPDAVTGEKDAVDADGNPVYQGIDTSYLVATLTAAIQELKAEFDTYKASHP